MSLHDLRHLRRALSYLLQEKRLLALTVLSGVIGFLVTFIDPWAIGALIDHVIAPDPRIPGATTLEQREWWLQRLALVGLLTPLLFSLGGFGRGHFNLAMGNRIVRTIRRDLFEHLQKLPLAYFSKQQSGSLVWTLMHEVHAINGLVHGGMVLVFLDLLQLLIATMLLCQISIPLTLGVLCLLPFYAGTFAFLNPYVRRASDAVQVSLRNLSGRLQEGVSGIGLVKILGAETLESARLDASEKSHLKIVLKQSRLGHAMGATSELFIHMGTGVIIGFGGYLALHGPDPLTAGQVARFIRYVGVLYGPLARFSNLNATLQSSLASTRKVFSMFDIPPQVIEHPDAVHMSPDRGDVSFHRVAFRYPNRGVDDECDVEFRGGGGSRNTSQEHVLTDVSFSVSSGEHVAIIGPSGAGKSTLVSLIPRLYDPTGGAILVDGVDVRDYSLEALRRSIAMVQQESFLFSGTIRENLSVANPSATEMDVVRAAKAANAHEFISALPGKYDTELGERGGTLSGGQRQRLSIAQALLRDPKILLLDEATSALDAESEVLVQEALDRLMAGRTCFIIAHRLSTIRRADRILALRDGKIVESGSHSELLRQDGLYSRLVRFQALPVLDGIDPLAVAHSGQRKGTASASSM